MKDVAVGDRLADSQDISVGVVPLCLPRLGLEQPQGDCPYKFIAQAKTSLCKLTTLDRRFRLRLCGTQNRFDC